VTCSAVNVVYETSQPRQPIGYTNFKCPRGHDYAMRFGAKTPNCKSCAFVADINFRLHILPGRVFKTNRSILRFRCVSQTHDPACKNPRCACISRLPELETSVTIPWSPECKNFIVCSRDFYSTPNDVMIGIKSGKLGCDNGHEWSKNRELMHTICAFETLFDVPFDDIAPVACHGYCADVRWNGAQYKIAYCHLSSTSPLDKSRLTDWAKEEGVLLFAISKASINRKTICIEIATLMRQYNMISELDCRFDWVMSELLHLCKMRGEIRRLFDNRYIAGEKRHRSLDELRDGSISLEYNQIRDVTVLGIQQKKIPTSVWKERRQFYNRLKKERKIAAEVAAKEETGSASANWRARSIAPPPAAPENTVSRPVHYHAT